MEALTPALRSIVSGNGEYIGAGGGTEAGDAFHLLLASGPLAPCLCESRHRLRKEPAHHLREHGRPRRNARGRGSGYSLLVRGRSSGKRWTDSGAAQCMCAQAIASSSSRRELATPPLPRFHLLLAKPPLYDE
jgi:hypothetical protein